MKKLISALCFLLLIREPATAQQPPRPVYLFSYFKNNGEDGLHLAYSTDGYRYQALNGDNSVLQPTAGVDKLMRDPCIIRGGDGRFHMVWTVSWNEQGIGYASSPDLMHWSPQRTLPVMAHEPAARNCWAPELFYDASAKQYVIYWATTIRGQFPETQSWEDNAYNHRIYYVATTDFKTFTPAKLLYEPGFNVIDATIQQDGNRYVMFLKDETRQPTQKNLKVAFSERPTGPYTQAGPPITGKYWAEGPTVAKVGGQWVVYFDKYTEQQYGAVASNDLNTWTDVSERVSFPKGTRHGTVLMISQAEFDKLKLGK